MLVAKVFPFNYVPDIYLPLSNNEGLYMDSSIAEAYPFMYPYFISFTHLMLLCLLKTFIIYHNNTELEALLI